MGNSLGIYVLFQYVVMLMGAHHQIILTSLKYIYETPKTTGIMNPTYNNFETFSYERLQ